MSDEPGYDESLSNQKLVDIRGTDHSGNRQESSLQSVLQRVSDIVIEIDADKMIRWSNQAAIDFFGSNLLGQKITLLFTDKQDLINRIQPVLSGAKDVAYLENWHLRRDKQSRLLSCTIQAVKESTDEVIAFLLFAQDITGQDRLNQDGSIGKRPRPAEDEGRVSGLWEIDLLAKRMYGNQGLAKSLGYPVDESTRSESWTSQLDDDDVPRFRAQLEDLIKGESESLDIVYRIQNEQGMYRWIASRGEITERDSSGKASRIVGTSEDVTQQKWEEQERRQFEMRTLRIQKMEAIGEMAGGIAHEFNNILTSVMGYTELALMEIEATENNMLSTYLQEVYQGGRRARDLIIKMLMFSRSDESNPANLVLSELVKDTVKILRASLPSSVEISIDIDEKLPEVLFDETLLQLVIMNICINARDAMKDIGAVYIRARLRQQMNATCASCHANFSGTFVELTIEDSGPGIQPAILDRIFEPYASSKDVGPGMGLSVVHGIVHKQNGHVLVDTILGDGAEFRIMLPPAEMETEKVELPAVPYTKISSDPRNAAVHILVVDDEVSLAYFIRELLHRRGYRVSVATDSHEAWDAFSASPDQFDLVITDQTMPGISGVQLAERMLKLNAELPIILCTGYSDVVGEHNVAKFGIKGYMSKPLDSMKLLELIDEFLQPASSGQQH